MLGSAIYTRLRPEVLLLLFFRNTIPCHYVRPLNVRNGVINETSLDAIDFFKCIISIS